MELKNPPLLPLPGTELVGRSLYLRPREPYALKDVLFKQGKPCPYYSKEAEETFFVREGLEVNDSPPMPSNQAINQTVIKESWEHLDEQLSVDSSVSAGNGMFSIDANASQATQIRTDEESFYALRNSFIPLWTVYMPNSKGLSKEILELNIPVPFKHAHRRVYEHIFNQYGTHYIRQAWVGGKAMLAFTIAK